MPGIVIDIGDGDGKKSDALKIEAEQLKKLVGLVAKIPGGSGNAASLASAAANFFGGSVGRALMIGAGVAGVAGIAASAAKAGLSVALESARSQTVGEYQSGVTGKGNYGILAGMSSATGVNMAALSQSLADRLRGDGLAAGWARGQGIVDLGPYTLDKFENLQKTIDALRKVQDRQYRMYLTRELVGAEAAPLVEMSEQAYRMKRWFDEQNELSPVQRQSMDELGVLWQGIKDTFSAGVAQWMADLNLMASGRGVLLLTERLAGLFGGGENGKDSALDENTRALHENTRAARRENMNLGPRGKRAVPRAWRGVAAEEAMKEQARLLGGI